VKQQIQRWFQDSAETKVKFAAEHAELIQQVAAVLVDMFRRGNKLLLFGNGGSAMDASHMAAEFVGRYRRDRHALAAIALTTDQAKLTCIANDYDFSEIFARQVSALGRPGDVAIGISTSGNSPNVLKALETARQQGGIGSGLEARVAFVHAPEDLPALLQAKRDLLATLFIALPLAGKKEETVGFLGACILDHVIERQKLGKGLLEAWLGFFVLTLGLIDTSLQTLAYRRQLSVLTVTRKLHALIQVELRLRGFACKEVRLGCLHEQIGINQQGFALVLSDLDAL